MKYKAGDVVLIVSFMHGHMNSEMINNFCGKEMTIDYISPTLGNFGGKKLPFYRMQEDAGSWGWTDSMISRLATRYPRSSESKLKKSLPLI